MNYSALLLSTVLAVVVLISSLESDILCSAFRFHKTSVSRRRVSVSNNHQYHLPHFTIKAEKSRILEVQYSTHVTAADSDESPEGDDGGEEGEGEEEEVEEGNASPAEVPAIIEEDTGSSISLIKQGFNAPTNINGSDVRVGIIMARWNADIIQGLYKGVNESLTACGVQASNVFTTYVPGAYEIPITAKFLTASKRFDVIICLGCLIKGDTMHFEYIAEAVSSGIMQVSLETMVPCVFGILTVLNKEQAIVRSTGEKNEGLSWGVSAVEMGLARMSAMGVGVKPQTPGDKSAAFVSFKDQNITSSSGNGNSSAEAKPKKVFGF